VENRAGASGNIGADAVAKAAPDGYTVLFGIDSTLDVNPHIYKCMPFKPADLRPVMIIASSGLLVGPAASKRLADLSDRHGKVIRATGMTVE
jgi:tripartite-type tricarboxylate transporter receptor subunit TctC